MSFLASSMSASSLFSTSRMMRLPALMVSGAPLLIAVVYSASSASRPSGSATRLMSPMRSASAASRRRPVKKMSFANPGPTTCVKFFIAELRDVRPRDERLAAFARQHDEAHVGVLPGFREERRHRLPHVHGERVVLLRVVEADVQHVAVHPRLHAFGARDVAHVVHQKTPAVFICFRSSGS